MSEDPIRRAVAEFIGTFTLIFIVAGAIIAAGNIHDPSLIGIALAHGLAIAILSYTDNRSSTYLFLYVALPLLIAATLWLALVLAPASGLVPRLRLSSLTAALGREARARAASRRPHPAAPAGDGHAIPCRRP